MDKILKLEIIAYKIRDKGSIPLEFGSGVNLGKENLQLKIIHQ